jgi:hypothetical protein
LLYNKRQEGAASLGLLKEKKEIGKILDESAPLLLIFSTTSFLIITILLGRGSPSEPNGVDGKETRSKQLVWLAAGVGIGLFTTGWYGSSKSTRAI